MLKERIAGLLDQRRPGHSLPRDFYVDDEIFRADMQAIFETDWVFACNVVEIPRPGDYVTLKVGDNPVVVLRDREGRIAAFHNSCRHRGSLICQKERGRANRLVCPYHQWVYELDGSLINARQMPEDFDRAEHGLAPVHVEVICGMVYICLAEQPPSLARFRAGVTPYIAPHMPDRTKVAFTSTIVEEANWKLVIENNRECYHCAGNHPELLVTLVEFALPDDPLAKAQFQADGPLGRALGRAGPAPQAGRGRRRVPLHPPALQRGLPVLHHGRQARLQQASGRFHRTRSGSVRMFRVPNNWNHFLSDHILHFRVLPLSANRTEVRTTWLVHEDAVEGVDYDLQRLTEVWLATNDEDRVLAENNHRGILSRAYRPGPYAPSEFMLNNFSEWYAGKMGDFTGGPQARIAAE